jgi:anti-anti-sigma regulatory factor
MLKISSTANGATVFAVSGHLNSENLVELQNLIDAETQDHRIVLDLKELTLVDQKVVRYLKRCESKGIELRNCSAYIREWVAREGDEE